jgi:hypothetical protein
LNQMRNRRPGSSSRIRSRASTVTTRPRWSCASRGLPSSMGSPT